MRCIGLAGKRILTLVGVLALSVVVGGCSRQTQTASSNSGGKRIIMLINSDDPFWDTVFAGMKDAAKEMKLSDAGFRVELDKNDGSPKGQIDKLTQYAIQTDVAAVAISPTVASSTQIADAMRKLRELGIKVICIDSDMDRSRARDTRFAYLGTDNVIGGQELGKAAHALRPNGGKYAAFVGIPSAENATNRIKGFDEGAGPDFKRIEYLSDDTDRTVAQKNVRDALDRHPEIDTLVGIWSYNAHPIAETVRQRQIRDKLKVVVFDAAESAINDMTEGSIDAMVVQNPYQMGHVGVELMKALIDDDQAAIHKLLPAWDPEKKSFRNAEGNDDIISTELRVVVPDDKSPVKKELFKPETKFFTLPEFKKWLDERKLTNS
jgi:ribose transport system substrate-binding protein